MSTPTIKFLGVSTEEPAQSNKEKSTTRSRLMLHGRVNVFNQDGSFDVVRIRLQGAIRTKIGSQVATELTSATTVSKTNIEFKPVYSVTQQATEEQYVDFVCPVPSPKDDMAGTVVPSMQMNGNTYLTKVTALTNRELLPGFCQMFYTLEAEFLRSSQVVRRVSCPVDISAGSTPLDAELSSLGGAHHAEAIAKPQSRSFGRLFGSQAQPQVSVEMPKVLGTLVSDFSTLSTGCRHLTVPVAVKIAMPPSARKQAQSMMEHGQLNASVKAKWYARRNFNTGFAGVESTVRSDRVSTSQFSVTLPPLYRSNLPEYTTTMDLNLLLPESISTPTVSTRLLNIGYNLELEMKFEHETLLQTPSVANLSLPVSLRPTRAQSMLYSRSLDPSLGYFNEQVISAPPPYVM